MQSIMSGACLSRAAAFAMACALTGACGGGTAQSDATAPKAAAPGGGEQARPANAGNYASAPENPCDWIPAADVARSVGALAGTPTRVRSAESPSPDPRGTGCLYTLAQQPAMGKGTVTVEVVLNQGVIEQDAIGRARDILARELNDGAAPAPRTEPPTAPAGRWDYAGRLPNVFIGRQGTIGVHIGTESLAIKSEVLEALAASVLDRLPDRPFSLPPNPDLVALAKLNPETRTRPSTSPDPCTLLTREEAEAALGPLSVAPYRSGKDSALATPEGDSCSYYTTRHRALIITPEWASGRMLFGMLRGVSGLTGAVLGQPATPSSATGPWEKVAADVTGGLSFLKADRMLTVHYRTSAADKDGALRLAAQAVNRL
jgi:hypothetical protein